MGKQDCYKWTVGVSVLTDGVTSRLMEKIRSRNGKGKDFSDVVKAFIPGHLPILFSSSLDIVLNHIFNTLCTLGGCLAYGGQRGLWFQMVESHRNTKSLLQNKLLSSPVLSQLSDNFS